VKTNSSFFALNPDLVLEATEDSGWLTTGEFTQLNSYENRVFDIRLEESADTPSRVIAKFYRPGRWSADAILEEHGFLAELQKEGISAVAPLIQKNGSTLSEHAGMLVTFFPKIHGKMPEEFLGQDLKSVGRLLARVHNVGARSKFRHRPVLAESPFNAWDSLELLSRWVAPEVWPRYESAAVTIIERIENEIDPKQFIRIHGDCHRGNLLFNKEFFFVDFDDSMMGPPAQDFWMLLQDQSAEERELLLSGYRELRDFSDESWGLIPILRGLRIISYSSWIARRWEDPSFPRLFPQFQSYTWWAEETEAIEKLAWSSLR
jgi:Ser/Thr protein kinase RdoA (MazF antagonist)